jgi:hypothetical protein
MGELFTNKAIEVPTPVEVVPKVKYRWQDV